MRKIVVFGVLIICFYCIFNGHNIYRAIEKYFSTPEVELVSQDNQDRLPENLALRKVVNLHLGEGYFYIKPGDLRLDLNRHLWVNSQAWCSKESTEYYYLKISPGISRTSFGVDLVVPKEVAKYIFPLKAELPAESLRKLHFLPVLKYKEE